MGVITYTAASLTLKSTWTRANNQKPATIAEGTRRFTVTRIPPNATVRSAVLTFDLDGTAYGLNSNYRLCTAYGVKVSNNGSAQKQSVRVNITANRTIDIVFRYQAFEYSGEVGKSYYRTVTFGTTRNPITLTIEFDEGDDPGYIDNEVMEPARGVYLYGPNETDFEKNGIKLQPISCTVSEEAGGEYELEMEHPLDPEGRWQSILEDWIIDAPVPPHKIPEITMPVGKVYRVKSTVTKTPLYSRLPVYSSAKVDKQTNVHGGFPQWSANVQYSLGDVVWINYNGRETLFRSGGNNFGSDQSPLTGGSWLMIGPVIPTKEDELPGITIKKYTPGVIIRDLVTSEQVTYIATYNWKYVRVRDRYGHVGYAIKADIEETSTAPQPYTIPGRKIYRQYFRVYSVSCDEAGHTLSVSARHISYDLDANATFDCSMTEAEPATAIALLQGSMMVPDLLQYKPHYADEAEDAESRKRLIACPMTQPTITADWSFQNPVQAILDPEEGLAGQLQARVERDNGDIFLLPQSPVRNGPRLAYGVNLTGVTWTRSSEEIITRIMPRAKNNNDYIYLDELYIDSPHINDYPFPRIEVLDSEYSIGQQIEHADGTKETLSKTAVIERMRQEAENRYYVDGADKATVTLDVEFILLGDTEEYRQYRNLQRVCLYDRIRIDTGHTTATAQVIGYEWDCLAGRYSAVSIGKVYSQARRQIPGYRMATGAVTYSKLSPGLIKWIKGAT